MELKRQIRYYYLRFIRLRGEPHELALGMSFGIFAGMMPIMPVQMALAVALALVFKGSKITAALGTWISNPLNWYFLYYYSQKLGAYVLGIEGQQMGRFSSIMASVRLGEDAMVIAEKILAAGGLMIGSFLTGGLIMGIVTAIPSYFILLFIFKKIKAWRESRKGRKNWRVTDY
ncbi:MAG: DUF2062 domain-containing protein [Deltaproteobacteria bacterium]|nr:DUF2062 domain-containing protein [Deltaproteobacteria bacterium]